MKYLISLTLVLSSLLIVPSAFPTDYYHASSCQDIKLFQGRLVCGKYCDSTKLNCTGEDGNAMGKACSLTKLFYKKIRVKQDLDVNIPCDSCQLITGTHGPLFPFLGKDTIVDDFTGEPFEAVYKVIDQGDVPEDLTALTLSMKITEPPINSGGIVLALFDKITGDLVAYTLAGAVISSDVDFALGNPLGNPDIGFFISILKAENEVEINMALSNVSGDPLSELGDLTYKLGKMTSFKGTLDEEEVELKFGTYFNATWDPDCVDGP